MLLSSISDALLGGGSSRSRAELLQHLKCESVRYRGIWRSVGQVWRRRWADGVLRQG